MATILERIAGGEPGAVEASLDEYGGLVWRLASRYLDGASDEVEDAAQEVFVEVWMRAKRFDPSLGSEAAFVATIAHRRLTDYQRRVSARGSLSRRSRDDLRARVLASGSPADRLGLRDLADEFDRLPEDERQALWLSIHSGMSHRQIGEATQTPVGTVKTRLRNGLRRLCEAMGAGERGERSREVAS
ncbi:MAG: RNA polymerase sigma factor [Phycisphaerales bacterium JB040]